MGQGLLWCLHGAYIDHTGPIGSIEEAPKHCTYIGVDEIPIEGLWRSHGISILPSTMLPIFTLPWKPHGVAMLPSTMLPWKYIEIMEVRGSPKNPD